MSKDSADKNRPFDLDKLRELVEMMEKHDVTEVNLQHGDEKWRLRRGPREVIQASPAMPLPVAASVPAPTTAPPADEPAAPQDTGLTIDSPTVGTFYSAPSPDDAPFVQVGSKVSPDTTVCVVEAMKVFNNIPAGVSGTIAEILVSNGDPVDFGQPLFRVNPT